ncbi:MAG: Glycosidase-related protein [Candidatus Nomurabacteria bacterium GW2011_GWF2_40_31]|uniref:Glycosidase-related protein n=2 Tax=Candidatus Nomuraibacteriota TaxID=1752729 RepID=A0A837HVJ4_9BACT|nr:MAG: Glycosidase-related protein [Candidatus Nomurabacteria bacterium GW2011_GWD2_39_12]KKR20315.1 MAG: Glycosidase-related protein [Candidatus Nomurabacteria bacterium GW2011_GWC2_39_41]KKR36431.1 MAG: Glycosidase-related protein [Candidatus Nomurabacteria bacterium GW2011_GWE2_40_10]KKR38409.1 MAG: Glycosidase-related protein [Candidatus Nomurabacteria bacterium GW2011_GWB1_40_11]KKR39480.1 MAG: Glycosidase-related protein [Parcubacteria group bacterium GW2011_GWC1_40_11]KKR59160.1 MAG: G
MFVVKRSHHNPILVPDKDHYFEAFATFNMSVIKVGKIFYGVYRAVSAVDKLRTLEQISTIGIGESKDGTYFEERRQFIKPEEEWEKYGCEDPRVTYFEGQYYIFYTALSKYPFEASGIKVAVAVSKDLKKVNERHLVTPFNAKAMTLFGERVGGKVTVIVAVNTDMPPAKIAIAQMDRIEELWNVKFWEEWYKNIDKHVVDLKRFPYDHVEVGATPVKTKEGWLLLYSHIQNYFPGSNLDRIFGIEAVLLDKNNPLKVLGRTGGPLMAPREPYELLGHVPDVIFPSGALVKKDTLFIYYGAADMTACVAHVNLNDLISTMRSETSERWNFKRYLKNPIITPKTTHPWEAKATFNPAVLRLGDTTHILYRALSADNTSSIGYAASKDGVNIDERLSEPIYSSRESFESKKVAGANSGCEDPRLTKIGKTIYMCYTAFDGIGPARVAITSISEKNFLQKNWKWEKPVVITPEGFDDKDTCIFPEKTKGKYFILHRVGDQICGDYFKTLNFKNETVKKCIRIIGPRINSWDSSKVGITAPPIKTKYGWLLLYHGVSKSHNTYRVGAVLLDKNDPALVISRTTDPIFEPREPYEKLGIVNNVVFPCGMALQDDLLYIYYGAADSVVGVATVELNIILKALTRDIKKKK